MTVAYLISPQGEFLPAAATVASDSPALTEGSVHVAQTRGSCRIRLHRGAVTEEAICELNFWMAYVSPAPIALSWFEPEEGRWRSQVLRTRSAACRKLLELTTPLPKHFVSLPHDPQLLDRASPFAPLLAAWRANSGALALPAYVEHLTGPLRDRFYLVKLESDDTSLTMQSAGGGCPLVSRTWAATCAGAQMEDQADVRYAVAVARTYRAAAQTDTPIWHDISTDMDLIGRGPQRAQYQRLVLPLKDRHGGRWVLGATFLDPTIAERIEVA